MRHPLGFLSAFVFLASTMTSNLAWADNFDALMSQEKAVCQSNCESAEGMVFLSQGGPFNGPNAVNKCMAACDCIDSGIPRVFTETEFMAYATGHASDAMLSQKYDQLVRTCVSQVK